MIGPAVIWTKRSCQAIGNRLSLFLSVSSTVTTHPQGAQFHRQDGLFPGDSGGTRTHTHNPRVKVGLGAVRRLPSRPKNSRFIGVLSRPVLPASAASIAIAVIIAVN